MIRTYYQIKLDYLDALKVDPVTGEVSDDIDFDKLRQLEDEMDTKINNTIWLCKEYEAKLAGLEAQKAEILKQIDRAITSCKSNVKSLKDYLGEMTEGEKFKGQAGTVYQMKVKDTVKYSDTFNADTLPDAYKKVKVEANTTAIAKALQNGETIDGCELVTGRTTTVVK